MSQHSSDISLHEIECRATRMQAEMLVRLVLGASRALARPFRRDAQAA